MWMAPFALAVTARAAEPVFVPDFSPGSGEEFAVTVMLQSMVVDELVRDGFVVLTNDVVGKVVGPDAVATCAARPGCPADVLPRVPSQIAVVVSIDKVGEELVGNVALYESGAGSATETLFLAIVGGEEQSFASAISDACAHLLDRLGPSPDSLLLDAAKMIAGQLPPSPVVIAPAPVPVPVPPPAPPPAPAPAPAPIVEGDLAARLDGTGIARRYLVGSEASFLKTTEDPRDWIYRTMPHAGRFTFEVRSGIGMGDVDRLARVRVETTAGEQTNAWYEEGPVAGRRVRGDLFVGYAPATMFDFGLLGGVQYGRRGLSTGVVQLDATGAVASRSTDDLAQIESISVYLQPRARLYLVPLGPAKPFVFAGADLRVFDGYNIEQPPSLAYPTPPGGVVPGFVGGGGMMIDPGPMVGLFAEGSYTRHFGEFAVPRTYAAVDPWPHDDPTLSTTLGITVAVVGGVQFRL